MKKKNLLLSIKQERERNNTQKLSQRHRFVSSIASKKTWFSLEDIDGAARALHTEIKTTMKNYDTIYFCTACLREHGNGASGVASTVNHAKIKKYLTLQSKVSRQWVCAATWVRVKFPICARNEHIIYNIVCLRLLRRIMNFFPSTDTGTHSLSSHSSSKHAKLF